jgi:CheY-like chemotaxis protein
MASVAVRLKGTVNSRILPMDNDSIWIVNQDEDDHQLIREIFQDEAIPNPVEFFNDGDELLKQLDQAPVAPFIIMSDVNLKGMDGFELREKMLKAPNLKFHSVPFIFWSAHASPAQIKKAYDLRAHGFFIKEASFDEWKKSLVHIIQYWRKSCMPDKSDKTDEAI